MTEEIVELASRYGRYGYRRVTALLRMEGWDVNHKRVERIWRREGLKVPAKQPKRGRLRPQGPNHVWAYDFVLVRTQDSRAVRLLTVIDEYTRECLAIRADRQIRSSDVIETLAELMMIRGVPDHIRSDNGPEFTARAVREWLGRVGARTLYIEPGILTFLKTLNDFLATEVGLVTRYRRQNIDASGWPAGHGQFGYRKALQSKQQGAD